MADLSALVATRHSPAIAHRTWSIAGSDRCHLFLLRTGRAMLAFPPATAAEIGAPALLWLPSSTRASWQVLAGGDGFAASVSTGLVQRAVGDAALSAPLRPLLDQIVIVGSDTLQPCLSALTASFEALADETQALRPGTAAMNGLHLGLILVQLWRCAGLNGSAEPYAAGTGTVRRFRQLVELHYRDGMRIDAFASRLGVSRAQLHDACRRATGRTPLALLHGRVLAEAMARLEQTDLSVKQVGYGIGFRDPGYFSRFFKRLTGQSPGAHRRAAVATRTQPPAASFEAWP